ncbi:MAG: hypothetical protein ABJA98_27925 [Acidobacteriota bacterium]
MSERRSTGIADFVGELKRSRAAATQGVTQDEGTLDREVGTAVLEPPPILELPPAVRTASRKGPGRPAGKRSDPEYRQTFVRIRTETWLEALAHLRTQNANPAKTPDFSDHVERVLAAWNRRQRK